MRYWLFFQFLRKCVEDCAVDWEVYYLFKNDVSNIYNIGNKEILEFITLNPDDFYYVFESSEDCIEGYPKISFIKGYDNILINKDKQSEKGITVKINTVKSDINIMNFKEEQLMFDRLFSFAVKKMIIFKSNKEHILLLNNFINNKNKIKYLKYNDTIKYEDILNINDKYFQEYSEDLFILEKEETYIIYFDYDINDNVHVAINPKECEENISFDPYKNNYLYLTKDKTYTLELPSDISDIMIKLSRKTSNSIISIGDNKLDSNNLYYLYENNNNAKLTLKVDKNDAIIEFLHNITMHNIIENVDYNYSNLILNKSLNILKIPKDFKKINIEIKADDNTQYSILQGYSIPPYSHYFLVEEENLLTLNHLNFTIDELYNKNIKIMDDEYYLVVISLFSAELKITIKGEHYQEEPSDENKNENENGLEWYKILLIVLGSVIFVVIIIIIVIIVIRKKKTNSSDESEEKRQILTE